MEQRNGRVDRHGQKNPEVHVYHFVGAGFDATKPGQLPGDLEGDLEFHTCRTSGTRCRSRVMVATAWRDCAARWSTRPLGSHRGYGVSAAHTSR